VTFRGGAADLRLLGRARAHYGRGWRSCTPNLLQSIPTGLVNGGKGRLTSCTTSQSLIAPASWVAGGLGGRVQE
jgi:hypothetical protein